ncbi:NAD(P)H-binding protein [uncultured Amnibacterium sp.]|uniref:NmrA family NAD(P)-binding protein n=1 Tax=uncultured Amnibacterium sp. TaxID=1631851 RepID=UPI0035CB676A
MIVITGATGALNGATVEHLLGLVPADRVAVSVRDVGRAQHLADRGVRVRRGSYDDPAALLHSFEGAEQVLLVSSSDPRADGPALHLVGVEAAVAAGAQRILYTSHQNAKPDTAFGPGRDHAETEALLAQSGVAWTSFRNGFYAHSIDWMLGPWQSAGAIATPADGPVSWTDRSEQAEAAAVVLSRPGGFDGPITLTASAAPDFTEIAAIAAGLTGRPIERVVLDDEDWVAAQIASGAPEAQSRFTLGFFQAARRGDFAGVDPLLRELLDREPRGVSDLLAERVSAA